MRNKKVWKFLGIIMSVSMIFTLNGCGSEKKEESQGESSSENAEFSWDMCSGDTITVLFNEHQYVTPIIEKMELNKQKAPAKRLPGLSE